MSTNRTNLKAYFSRNAIPTEGQFAELIDAQLNQADDGVFKPPGEPLSMIAAPGNPIATGDDPKSVLRLYANYPSSIADWTINLNPQDFSTRPPVNRAGLGITDSSGILRLFLDSATGNIGIGTNAPEAHLHVNGDMRVHRVRGPGSGHAPPANLDVEGDILLGGRLSAPANGKVLPSGMRAHPVEVGESPYFPAVVPRGATFISVMLELKIEAASNSNLPSGEFSVHVGDSTVATSILLPHPQRLPMFGAATVTEQDVDTNVSVSFVCSTAGWWQISSRMALFWL